MCLLCACTLVQFNLEVYVEYYPFLEAHILYISTLITLEACVIVCCVWFFFTWLLVKISDITTSIIMSLEGFDL